MSEHVEKSFKAAELAELAAASGGDLKGHAFEDCVFEQCDLKGVKLDWSRFVGCKFQGCDLSNVGMANARLRDVAFERCKLIGIQWIHLADLINPAFKECNLGYGNFVGLKLKKTVLTDCNLRECDFSQADLAESCFARSDLLNARFHGTALLKADFRGATNYLIDPVANKVRGARFSLPEAQGLLAGLGVVIE